MKIIKRITSVSVVLLLFLSFASAAISVSASDEPACTRATTISPGLEYIESYSAQPDGTPLHSFMFEYSPGMGTDVVAAYGEKLFGGETLSNIILHEEKKGLDVRGGINADFFSMQTGIPIGGLICGGSLMSSCSGENAFGIRKDGSYIFGVPGIHISLSHNGNEYEISHYNKYPTIYLEYLLSPDFYSSTLSESESTEIVISFPDSVPTLGQSYVCRVLDVYRDSFNNEIPEGTLVLSVNNKSVDFEKYASVAAGDTVILSFDCDPGWESVYYAVGGSDIFISDGKFVEETITEYHEKVRNPRTAVGVREDGTFVFYAAEGSAKEKDIGLTLRELGDELLLAGCAYALNLDGGGSTTVCVKDIAGDRDVLMNVPTGGGQRRVSNALLFVNTVSPSGIASKLILSPRISCVALDGYIDLDIFALDTSGHKLDINTSKCVFSSDDNAGIFIGNRFYPKGTSGTYKISAELEYGGKLIYGETLIYVVENADRLVFEQEKIYINRGSTATVGVGAFIGNIPVSVDQEKVKYSFVEKDEDGNDIPVSGMSVDKECAASCEYGFLGNDGIFHSVNDGKNHVLLLKAEYGELYCYTEIHIGIPPTTFLNFESGDDLFEIFRRGGGEFELMDFGRKSAHAVKFTGNSLSFLRYRFLSSDAAYLEIWRYGKATEEAYAEIADALGVILHIKYEIAGDYSSVNGWTRLKALIPDGTVQPVSLRSVYRTDYDVSVVLDNFSVNYGDESVVFADINDSWAYDYIMESYRMGISDGAIKDGERFFYPDNNLTRAEFAKFFSVFLRLPVNTDIRPEDLSFEDTEDMPVWAAPYISALCSAGYMRGKDIGGKLYFEADSNITREEVMYVFGNLIPDNYTCELNFNDNDDIALWARGNIEKILSYGLISGYGDNTLLPKKNISRAEIVSVFVRAMRLGVI